MCCRKLNINYFEELYKNLNFRVNFIVISAVCAGHTED